MKISVIRAGYVASVSGTYFTQMVNDVIFVDVDDKKIESLKQGNSPILSQIGKVVNNVRTSIGSEAYIVYSFIYSSFDYGRSCFLKYAKTLAKTVKKYGCIPCIIDAIKAVDCDQKSVVSNKVIKRFDEDLSGKTFTYSKEHMQDMGFKYFQIGVSS